MKHSIRMKRSERRWLSDKFDLERPQRRANAKNHSVPRRSQDPIDHRPHPYTHSPSNRGKQHDLRADDDPLRGRQREKARGGARHPVERCAVVTVFASIASPARWQRWRQCARWYLVTLLVVILVSNLVSVVVPVVFSIILSYLILIVA